MHTVCNEEFHPDIEYQPQNSQTLVSAIEQYLKRWASRINTVFVQRKQQRINRQAFNHLLALDDHILDDIGVTRNDIVEASQLPLDVNASLELEKIARANKTNGK